MAGLTLFEIVDEYRDLYEMMTDPDVDPQLLADSLESIIGQLEVKACGYVQVIKQLDMEAKQAKEVAQMFAEKAKVRENNVKRMKEALKAAMEQTNQKEVTAGAFTIKLQANGGKEPIIYDSVEDVPQNLMKVKYEVDGELVRDYLEQHPGTKWAHIGERGNHIVIK